MPGENILIFQRRRRIRCIMHKEDVPETERVLQLDVQLLIQGWRKNIVVTGNEQKCDLRKLLPPEFEVLYVIVGGTVEHIAYYNDPRGMIFRNELLQAVKIFLHDIRRNSNTGFPEVCRLAHMQVRYDQRLLFLPIHCPSGRQQPVLFSPLK